MSICHFCTGEFGSEQGVRAHMKKCELYQDDKRKKAAALGRLPKAAVTSAPVQPTPPVETPDLTAPLRDLVKSMCETITKQDTPQTPQQQQRQIVQTAKAQVLDHYRPLLGHVTSAMRGDARAAIERELSTLPLEELPFEEVLEIAAAIRDGCYASAFTRQAREATRQRVEEERRHKKEVETLGAMLRADRRKKTFIQQANHQAEAYCQEKAILGWEYLRVLADVEARLDVFLTGDEPIVEAQAIVQSVLAARIAESEAILAAAQAKANEKWREEMTAGLVLGAVVGLVVLSLKYPEQTLAIFKWIERTFGYTPGANADAPNPEAPKTAPPTSSAEARPSRMRRRKYSDTPSSPESPWGNSVGGEPAHA